VAKRLCARPAGAERGRAARFRPACEGQIRPLATLSHHTDRTRARDPVRNLKHNTRHANSAVVFGQIAAHIGFAQTPNVPRELGRADIPGLELDPSQLAFFVGAPTSNRARGPGWPGAASAFIPASYALRRGRPISSASRRTGASSSADRAGADRADIGRLVAHCVEARRRPRSPSCRWRRRSGRR
jgi:hypothetical protein